MCVSAFVFGEFILLSVQPVALATSVIETLTFPVRISVLRILRPHARDNKAADLHIIAEIHLQVQFI